jgi:hypothetical protein
MQGSFEPLDPAVPAAVTEALLIFLPILLVYGICIWQAGALATRRGRSRTKWTFRTVLFGPFALLALAILPSRREPERRRSRHRVSR